MREFSEYEELIIREIIEMDSNREEWGYYIGIPVLSFLSKTFANNNGIYISINEEHLIFEYSIRERDLINIQNILLEQQRRVIFALHLIKKLMQKSYLVGIELDEAKRNTVINSLPTYSFSEEMQTTWGEFAIAHLQESFSNCLYQAMIVTEDLRELVNSDFKTKEQIRYESEIEKMQEQINKAHKTLNWTIGAFFAALIPALFTVSNSIREWVTPKENSISVIIKPTEQKELPSTIKTKNTNDSLIIRNIAQKEKTSQLYSNQK